MKRIKLFEEFFNEAAKEATEESKKVQAIRKKLDGRIGAGTIVNMYKFYWEKEYRNFKGSKLLSKLEYYDQAIRQNKEEDMFKLAKSVGIQMVDVDKFNQQLAKPFIGQVKVKSPEFENLWIIVQHADFNMKLQQTFLKVYGKEMKVSNPQTYNMLVDRVAVNSGEPQVTLSQGMQVTYGGKFGWLPWQMKGIKLEGEAVSAKDESGNDVQLVKWAQEEDSKINEAIAAQIGPGGVKKAKAQNIKINLSSYVKHVMKTEFVGNYMIKT